MAVEIRQAEPSDLAAVQAVAREAWYAAHAPIIGEQAVEEFLGSYYDRDSLRQRLEEDAVFPAAVDREAVIGFAVAGPAEGKPATFVLGRLYVTPERWGEEIGRRLLRRVEARASDRGGERMRLGVMAENDRAVGFYEAAGYERVGEHDDERIDATAYEYEKRL